MSQSAPHAKPITIVIFGASGDLTQRKLLPALFNLYCKGRLPAYINIIGFAITSYSDDQFQNHVRAGIEKFAGDIFVLSKWDDFAAKLWLRPIIQRV